MRPPLLIKFLFAFIFFCPLLSITANCAGLSEMMQKAKELSENITFESIISLLSSGLSEKLKTMMQFFFISFAVITVGVILSSLKDGFSNEGIIDTVSDCILILSAAGPLEICFDICSEHIEALCGYMLAFVPTSVMLYTASGSTFSASLSASSVPIAVSVIESVSASVVLPLIKGMCSLCIVNSFCRKANLSAVSGLLKSVCLWIIGLGFTLFTGVLSLQSVLQSGLDNLTIKGLRYGAAKLIPIAGGMISESMRTVLTSISFIKNVTGTAGIIFIIYTCIPSLCTLIAAKLYFGLLSAFAKGTMQEHASGLFDSLSSILGILMSLVIGVSVAFVIVFAIFMKTNVSI